MELTVTSPLEAEAALDAFNGFHDGFIRELRLVSHDWFADRGVQRLTGDLDLTILFAHYNYGQGEPPPDRLVSASFARVKDLELRVTGVAHEWSVNHLSITAGSRPTDTGESEFCLRAVVVQNELTDEQRWQPRDILTFTFTSARLGEVAL